MKNIKAFTLVELIVSIVIISIIASTGLIYFSNTITSNDLQAEIDAIYGKIEDLNFGIANEKYSGYSVKFSENYLIYKINEDFFDQNTISFSNLIGSTVFTGKLIGTIASGNENNMFYFSKYYDNQLIDVGMIYHSGSTNDVNMDFNGIDVQDYNFQIYNLNNMYQIGVFLYSKREKTSDEKTKFLGVYENENRTNKINNFELKNINGKNSFSGKYESGTSISDNLKRVYVFFEKGSEISYFTLKK